MPKPVLLLILDGWGLGTDPANSAIDLAHTPTWDRLWSGEFPHTRLIPHGEAVGLTEGQMGNSEVGHLNLGAGRVVYQDLVAITRMIREGKLAAHERLNAFLDGVGTGALHFIGLFSDGGVHSHIDHLLGIAQYAAQRGVKRMYVHALLDGRDTPPAIAEQYFEHAAPLLPHGAQFATLGGRYFGMDRDKRWDRTRRHWNAIARSEGPRQPDWATAMQAARGRGETDEFVTPTVLGDYAGLQPGDSVLCFNFRADRMRQLVAALSLEEFDGFPRGEWPRVRLFTFTHYRDDFDHPVLLTYDPIDETLTETASRAGLTVYKSAETEKYAHVTYFFNGGREAPWPGEDRVLVPSSQVATYDLKPEMSIYEVTELLCADLRARRHDLYVVNWANGDMVGHTGVEAACIKACEAVDACLLQVMEAAAWGHDVAVLVTADHGNCDVLRWPDGTPHTQHSMNDVPLVLVDDRGAQLRQPQEWTRGPLAGVELESPLAGEHHAGEALPDPDTHPPCWSLCDIAPTVADLLELSVPDSWTGVSLLKR